MIQGEKMGKVEDTLIFIDEIQAYPHLLTMLKFLRDDHRFYLHCQWITTGRYTFGNHIYPDWQHSQGAYVSAVF